MKTWVMIVLISALVIAVPFSAALAQSESIQRTAGTFAVLAGTTVTCTTSTITGDVGVNLGGSVGACTVNGTTHVGDTVAVQAYNDFLAAYTALKPQPGDVCTTLTGTLAGVTLPPGAYCFDAAAALTGVLTLNGPSNGSWIFKIGTSGTGALSATNFNVVMPGGKACSNNVIWWSAQAATLTDSVFLGSILAGTSVTVTRGSLDGQALATDAVILTDTSVCGGGCTPPGAFNLLTPADGAVGVSTTGVTLDWTDSAWAATYTLYFGTTNPPPSYQSGLAVSQIAMPALTQNTPYYWTVVATNGCAPDATTAVSSFTTGTSCTPPGAVTLATPANGAVNQSITNLMLDWTDSAGAASYTLYFGTTNPPPSYQTGLTASQATIPTLTPNTLYYWSVVATNGCTPDATTGVWSFTTGTSCIPPGVFTLATPANGAVNQSVTNLMLDWTNSAGASSYTLYFGTTNPPPSYQTGLAASQATIPTLTPNTLYYWSVVATNGCTPNATTAVASFTTSSSCTPPGAFILLTPANGAVNQSITNLMLDWTDSAGATTYTLYFGTTNPPPSYQTGLGPSQVTIPTLTQNTTYYWKMVSLNGCSPDATTGVWSFTTGTSCIPPGVFTLTMPANGAINQSVTNLLLDWTDSVGATTYNLYLGIVNPPPFYQAGLAASQVTLPGLTQNTTYYWTVVATNGCVPDAATAVSSFSTGSSCTPPGAFTLLTPVNGAVNQSTTNLLLDWTDSVGATTYNLYLGTANPPPLFQAGLAVSQLTVPVLTQNITYYWTVTAANGCPPDFATAVWSFATGTPCPGPEAPQLNSPSNGAVAVAVPVTLAWVAAANAASYEVYVGLQPNDLILIGTTTDLFWVAPNLLAGTTYCWLVSAVNTCAMAHSPVWCFTTYGPAPPPVVDCTQFVIAARTSGAAGSNWVTDTMIFNSTDHAVNYHFIFTPGGEDGTASPYDFAGTISGCQSVVNLDILGSLYGLSDAAGNLRLVPDDCLHLTSRTYNQTDAGTYGQFIAGLPASEAVGGDTLPTGAMGQILGAEQSDTYRTNLGVMEVMGKKTTFVLRYYNAAGSLINACCICTGTVEAYSWWQKNLSELGIASGDNLRVEVEVTSGGAVLPYLSVVDARTNDAYYVPGQKVALVTHQLMATIAHSKGGLGTDWRSDVYLYNPSTITQTATLQFYSSAGPASNFVEVPAGGNVAVKDIVSELFSQVTGAVAGSLHLTSETGLLAISRTFNLTENGTYGEFIPARDSADLLAVNDTGHILQLVSNTAYRCNIGFSEYSGVPTQVQLTLFDINCRQLGSGTFQVAPYANLQLNGVFQILNIPGTVDAARAEVKVLSGGSIYAYGSVVDNRTGDPIFVPAQK